VRDSTNMVSRVDLRGGRIRCTSGLHGARRRAICALILGHRIRFETIDEETRIPSELTQIGKPRWRLAIPDHISQIRTASQFFEAVGQDAGELVTVSFLNLCARMQSFETCPRMRRPGFQDLIT
jgi:hypothetical protein